jgi:hypothetical protein
MKKRKLMFNDRMKVFPTQKSVQDLTKDDYIFFAEAWTNLQEQRCNPSNISNANSLHTRPTKKARCERTTRHDGQHPTTMHLRTGDSAGFTRGQDLYHKPSAVNKTTPQKIDSRTSTTSMGTTQFAHNLRSNLPLFRTPDLHFRDLLRRSNVAGDGSCLFKAFLRANDLDDNHHHELRQKCVSHIIVHWNRYEKYWNLIHSESPDFPPLTIRPFKRASNYEAYMLQDGKWGSDLEALAACYDCACLSLTALSTVTYNMWL